jgi:hypothetical protein
MIEWLLSPIDSGRAHMVADAVAWHGRSMVLAWGIVVPVGVIAARFFKILPGQDWPRELDNHAWWLAHRILHYIAGLLTLAGLALVLGGLAHIGSSGTHAIFGWAVVMLACGQFLGGWFRGSKGGPTDRHPDGSMRGDHYDMTPRRLVFEYLHKIGGYTALLVAMGAILTGLWRANAFIWMWIGISLWWAGLVVMVIVLQRSRRAVDTYQAIWGPDQRHPGNARRPIGFGVIRPGE